MPQTTPDRRPRDGEADGGNAGEDVGDRNEQRSDDDEDEVGDFGRPLSDLSNAVDALIAQRIDAGWDVESVLSRFAEEAHAARGRLLP